MKRSAYNELLNWKESKLRKPLVLKGARQIGKTWLLKEFGKREYKQLAYVNCDNEPLAASLFTDYNIDRIVRTVEVITKVKVTPGETLIVFDEIQEQPKGLAALKYFCENAREYHVAVAGSLLGITLHQNSSFPVGKVDLINLYPMTFEEFLWAMDEEALAKLLLTKDWLLVEGLHTKYIDLLRQYYYVGGMPEAVLAYTQKVGLEEVRKIQLAILTAYRSDFSKHAPLREVQRINMVFQSIPAQLAKENKKFIYGAVKKGGRATEFEIAIQWLIDAGLIYKVNRVNSPQAPLTFYEDFSSFKLFLFDCGLFGAMNATEATDILIGNAAFVEYKGAFTELYTLQQLVTLPQTPIYYYSADNSQLEIDFLLQHRGKVIPLEVKAEENLRAKSLKYFVDKFAFTQGYRTSMRSFKEQDWVINIPLYGVKSFFS
ncbi:MAG: ATP-binding protein [Phocaeicola sp.]